MSLPGWIYDNQVIRFEVVRLLGKIGDLRAVEPLLRIFNDSTEFYLRKSAAYYLGQIGAPSAFEPLAEVLSHYKNDEPPDWQAFQMTEVVAMVLGYIRDRRVVETL